jgi:putative ABC transport system permease protein
MTVLRYKIWRDLWESKARTLQVVLIIGIGAFAIGMIFATRNIVINRLEEAWRASSPAMIWLKSDAPVDDNAINALKRVDGVKDVEGFTVTSVEWRLSNDDKWSSADLIVRNNYSDQRYNRLTLVKGEWPLGDTFAVGYGGETSGIPLGGKVQIRINKQEYDVLVNGVIVNAAADPSGMGVNAFFYTTRDRMEELTGFCGFSRIMAGAPVYDEPELKKIATRMQRTLEERGIGSAGARPTEGPSSGSRIADPNKHFSQEVADAVFFILATIAVLALILGLFLVYNTINAVISRQTKQIGVMKAIGASTGQILRLYFSIVLYYGLFALLIAVPLGIISSWLLSNYIINSFYINPGNFTPSLSAVLLQVGIALLAPLIAALIPVFSGASITVREAITTYGLSSDPGILGRLLAKVQRISRLWLLTIINTFRRKGRVILTQITLVLSGLIFLTVLGVRDSALYSFKDVLFSIVRFNVNFQLEKPESISRIETLTLSHPGVKAVEMWELRNGRLRAEEIKETGDEAVAVFIGVPLPTSLYGPQIRDGRWLLPEDPQGVVLNQVLAKEAGVSIGDWVTFKQRFGGETGWRVVGLSFDPIIKNSAHVLRQALLGDFSGDRASTIWIQTVRTDADGEASIAADLRRLYGENHIGLSDKTPFKAETSSEFTENILNQFSIIFILLAVMAVIIGLVGSIALSGVLSLNVMERGREIGVMRAIGAKSASIAKLFIGEGLLLGWLSWLIALPFGLPGGWWMTQKLGSMINIEMTYHFTLAGPLYWLGIITVLSILASWLPARRAMGITVHESLAYE